MFYFIYGTLKKGCINHELIKNCEFVHTAVTGGYIYENNIPFFIPGQKEYICEFGSIDYQEDVQKFTHCSKKLNNFKPEPSVYGEVYYINDYNVWTSLDYLEGFRNCDDDLYKRFLYPVWINNKLDHAWIYGLLDFNTKDYDFLELNNWGRYTC